MYWLFIDAGEWLLCERGRLETARRLGVSATVLAEQVLKQLRSLFPDIEFVVIQDE
ncbi:MAG: hypothetical protein IT303_17810 [Dehalococcoidia bacterium]|nr:hypothetical protein [Dehalococcoidia bacterium]